ncbi:Threonyl/alanyl tRNA synthetase [Aspergillus bertholletiae]|uniref:Threonyl/alanyl tRNA synthetase n=1 Tax=Aspergillus bertholletiae TaxID=1226010 RepID=A0A5N7B899_9EURO|nr:Threonyl/alanyl tRNA synthetase [Aspergillus bertholletiae]
MAASSRTFLTYQHDWNAFSLDTPVTAVYLFSELEDLNRQLFPAGNNDDHIVATEHTIFHPQGGGQPSDVGTMTGPAGTKFTVTAVRMDATGQGQVLHLGQFGDGSSPVFTLGETVRQDVDAEKRLLHSRLHTAGHVLGAAVRHLLEEEVEGFDELKASHFPGSASCEFQGLIEGKWKEPIQKRVDQYIADKRQVQVEWWDEAMFREKGLQRLIPDRSLMPGEKFRVVNILGTEVYPCGGTHVDTTDLCGPTRVTKISRKSGKSRVSYAVKN